MEPKKFTLPDLCSLLESICKLEHIQQEEQDKIVKEMIERWVDQ